MSEERIVNEIISSIREVRRDEALVVGPDTELQSLEIDSLDFVELLFSLEEKFDVDIPFNANAGERFPFETVRSAAAAIEGLLAVKRSAA